MLRRDALLTGLAFGTIGTGLARGCGWAAEGNPSFNQLFAQTIIDEPLLEAGRDSREGLAQIFLQSVTMGLQGRPPRGTMPISQRAIDLIHSFEITSKIYYNKYLQAPIWPNGESGVTFGFGYDDGYATSSWLREDWDGILSDTSIARLATACEITGPSAGAMIGQFSDIRISYEQANNQFEKNTLPRAVGETAAALPNTSTLTQDCLGALVSLVYNRGPSFQAEGLRYTEMRAIRLHMVRNELEKIPFELRSMKHLWEDDHNMRGLLVRRELEARLFEEGLKND